MNDLTSEKATIRIPSIPSAFWKSIILCSMGALGIALTGDLSLKEAIGTLMIINAIGAGIATMFVYLDD